MVPGLNHMPQPRHLLYVASSFPSFCLFALHSLCICFLLPHCLAFGGWTPKEEKKPALQWPNNALDHRVSCRLSEIWRVSFSLSFLTSSLLKKPSGVHTQEGQETNRKSVKKGWKKNARAWDGQTSRSIRVEKKRRKKERMRFRKNAL